MIRNLIISLGVAGLVAAACTSSPTPSPSRLAAGSPNATVPSTTGSPYRPAIDPANFGGPVDNPYFALIPGTKFVYKGTKDGESQVDEVIVTDRTKVIMGVTCVAVSDVAKHGRTLLESTEDWYAQDKDGNVWYFGEDTKEYEKGKVSSTEGSWQSGVDGAQPGIVMPAHPKVTDSYRQEFYPGQAEDMFWVLSLSQKVSVPYGSYSDALLTMEWTPLEPEVIDQKYYVAGVGLVLETSAAGPHETARLVSLTRP